MNSPANAGPHDNSALQWALVTGASSGIGAAFARRLAAGRYNLVLVARRGELLEQLAAELRERHAVTVDILPADLATEAGIAAVEARLASQPELYLLVNNAGFGVPGLFGDVPVERLEAMIRVHDVATMRLCRAALPGMSARRRGAIINVSSVVALIPSPGATVYAASKAFLNGFSRALHLEVVGQGVQVQALCPGLTHSGFHDTPDYREFNRTSVPRFLWMTSAAVAAASLEALARGQVVCVPGWPNKAMVLAVNSPLGPLLIKLAAMGRKGI